MFERLIWVVPLAVTLLGLWRPRAGLVVLAAALPLFGSPPGGPYLAALDVAGIAAILTAWRAGRPRPSVLTWPVAAFVAVGMASLVPLAYLPPSWRPAAVLELLRALPGVDSWPALYTWRAAADLLLGWGLFLAARRAFSGRSARPLVWGLLSGLAVTVVVGLMSHAGFLSLDGYRVNPSPGGRLASVFFLSGWLSQYLVLLAPLALAAVYLGGRWTSRAGLLLAPLVLACIVLTQQRGAWLATLAQLAVWLAVGLVRGRRSRSGLRRIALSGAAVTALTAAILIGTAPPLSQLLAQLREIESGLTPRLAVWKVATEMVPERPLLGWGLGAWAPAHDLMRPEAPGIANRFRGTAHNLYLHVAAERGALGLVSLALLLVGVAVCLRRPKTGEETLALALGASLVGLAVYGLVQYVFYLRNLGWTVWLLFACVALVSREEGPSWVARAGRVLVAGALLMVPFRAMLVERPAFAGSREFGFHAIEWSDAGFFRWAEGIAARRIPWTCESLTLGLANGHPRAGHRPVTVDVAVDGRPAARLRLGGGWVEHRLELGPPRADWVVLTLATQPTFRPFSDFLAYDLQSVDIRSLGVAVKDLRCE